MKVLPSTNKCEMHHRQEAKYPMDVLSLNHLTVDARDGKTTKILTIVDEFSKFMCIAPVKKENSAITADVIRNNNNAIAERCNSTILNLLGTLTPKEKQK